MSDAVIETRGLHKHYGRKVAVADLTLDVPRGEVFGFLGPNGAGKSTAVKMLLGLVRPNGGQARVLGQPPGRPAVLARLGFLPEHFRFHEWLPATEFLDLHARLFGMDLARRRRRIPELLDLVGLTDAAHRSLAGFSKGMLQRIGLAQALLNDPELVFLDEPTSALDPFGRMLVRSIIHRLKAAGTTVFLNSHLLSEVEATCDRVSFIKDGRVLRTLALKDIEAGHLHVELRVDAVTPALLGALDALGVITEYRVAKPGGLPLWGTEYRVIDQEAGIGNQAIDSKQHLSGSGQHSVLGTPQGEPSRLRYSALDLTVADDDLLPAIAERTLASGARLYALTPRRASLEQLFLEIVGTEDSGQ